MSGNDKFRREVQKRLLELEKIAKEISEQIESLKLLLADLGSKKLETASMETSRREEINPPECLHYFGYLRFLQKTEPIPEECLVCQKLTECLKHM